MSPAADPTARPSVLLPEVVREWLADAAGRGYPHEVCGLLLGHRAAAATEIERAEPATNLETQRAADRYRLDPVDYLAIDARARRDGLDIVGVWHTHPDHPAEPSSTDLEAAWPDYTYVIISVMNGEPVHFRAWELVDGRFQEQAVLGERLVAESGEPGGERYAGP